MATKTTSNVIQIVGEDTDRVLDKEGLERLITNHCDKNTHDYSVFSIVGAQSSGKSTLINAIFGTEFQVMNAKEGMKATTKGIWASICNQPPFVLLDIEGSDGAEQKDPGFENQTALFALCVSDAIFVNIGRNDIRRFNAGSIPLLHRIFQERVNYEMHKTVIVFAVRDYDDDEAPAEALRGNIVSNIEKIYSQFPDEQREKLKKCFELKFEFLHHPKYKMLEFGKDCTEIARHIQEFVCDKGKENPIATFPVTAESLWKDILQNRRLDMASYWNTASEKGCTEIMSKILKSLRSNEEYESLKTDELKQPGVYCNTLDTILKSILSEYDRESQNYTTAETKDVRKMLEDNILEGAKEGFEKTMKNFLEVFLIDTKKDIEVLFKENLFKDMEKLLKDNMSKFSNKTKDLKFYPDVVQEFDQSVQKNLQILILRVRNKEVKKFVGKYAPKFISLLASATGVPFVDDIFKWFKEQCG